MAKSSPADPALLVNDTRAEALELAIDLSAQLIPAGYRPNDADRVVADARKFLDFLEGSPNN